MFSALLEVFGLCFFAIVILLDENIHPGLRIVMMNGVFFCPALWQAFKKRLCQEQGPWQQCFIFTLALILEISGIAVLTYQVSSKLELEKGSHRFLREVACNWKRKEVDATESLPSGYIGLSTGNPVVLSLDPFSS